MIIHTVTNRSTDRLLSLVVDREPHPIYKELYNQMGWGRFWLDVVYELTYEAPYDLGFTTA